MEGNPEDEQKEEPIKDLMDAIARLEYVIKNPGPQPKFKCDTCDEMVQSGHSCPYYRLRNEDKNKLIGGLDEWLRWNK